MLVFHDSENFIFKTLLAFFKFVKIREFCDFLKFLTFTLQSMTEAISYAMRWCRMDLCGRLLLLLCLVQNTCLIRHVGMCLSSASLPGRIARIERQHAARCSRRGSRILQGRVSNPSESGLPPPNYFDDPCYRNQTIFWP